MVRKFVLQWHISEICNLKCLHCYQESHKPIQLEYEKLEEIYIQFKDFIKEKGFKGHINITGGEPICSPYFFKILDLISKEGDLISFCVLTNGTLITDEIVKKIKKYNPRYIQVSLEGGKRRNDIIRGKGTHKKIGEAIKILAKNDIVTSVSFTATSINYKEFPKVVRYAKKCGANQIWSDRFIPLGDATDKNLVLTKEQTEEYLEIMKKERIKLLSNKTSRVTMNRALQFQKTKDTPYMCTAGISLLTVMENGDLVPCRRMPIVVGNLFKDKLIDLYDNSKVLRSLRERKVPKDCRGCEHFDTCNGGLKCLTYAIYGNLDNKDPGCSIII